MNCVPMYHDTLYENPMQVNDHADRLHEVVMKPGDIVSEL